MDKQPEEEIKLEEEKELTVTKMRAYTRTVDVLPVFSDSFFEKVDRKLTPISLSISQTHLVIHEKPTVNIYYGNILGVSIKKMDEKEKRSLMLKENDEYFALVIHFFSKISKQKLLGGQQIVRKPFV